MYNVFIGYDSREGEAYDVCSHTLTHHDNVNCFPLNHRTLRQAGLFTREWFVEGNGQYIDVQDGKPFSTEFSHSRFLTPVVAKKRGLKGWVLFVDCDFMFRASVNSLFDMVEDKYAVMCVQFDWDNPDERIKMDGVTQSAYPRKLWSSLTLWNLDHKANDAVTANYVNKTDGGKLHAFNWLTDKQIGALPPEWNYVTGVTNKHVIPSAVHFSKGGPWLTVHQDTPYAEEWRKNFVETRLKYTPRIYD